MLARRTANPARRVRVWAAVAEESGSGLEYHRRLDGRGEKTLRFRGGPNLRTDSYYNRSRTHLALEKDAPDPRVAHQRDPGEVIAFPEVGGLHHRYERRAA